jgi:molybdate transport system permease protein
MLDWAPLILTFKLAFVTTIILFVPSISLANYLAYSKSRLKPIIETLVAMPLVLPPTVLGFYLLVAFSPSNSFGQWLDEAIGLQLIFSFQGLVFASLIYSLPFMVHPLQSGLTNLPASLREASYVLGNPKEKPYLKYYYLTLNRLC